MAVRQYIGGHMDAKFINPFIYATMHVLETMAFTKSNPGKPYLKKDNIAKGDVAGVIGFTIEVCLES